MESVILAVCVLVIGMQRHDFDYIRTMNIRAWRTDLTVIGTVARSGIAGLLIGNTAERILRKLPCSVLAVKPDGFVFPVRVDSAD